MCIRDRYNIYFTCLDKLVESSLADSKVSLDLIQKSLSKKIPALFDEVFYMNIHEKEDGEKVRYLCTNNSIADFCKDRSGALNDYEKPDLKVINNKIFKEN